MYAKLENDELKYLGDTLVTPSGVVIVNPQASPSLLGGYGYKQVIDNKPEYNAETEDLSIKDYTEDDTTITINYEVVKRTPTQEEVIKDLNNRLNVAQDAIDFLLMSGLSLDGLNTK